MAAPTFRLKPGALQPEVVFTIEEGELARRIGPRTDRWPLKALTRITVERRVGPHGARTATVRLAFGRRKAAIGSLGYAGLGRTTDLRPELAAFVRALAAEAERAGARASARSGGARLAEGLTVLATVLGAAAVVLIAVSLSAGMAALGADLAARLAFGAVLILAVLPWIERAGAETLPIGDIPPSAFGL